MKLGLLNVRSLRNKMDHICEILDERNLDVLCLTETWLFESDLNIIQAALPKTHSIINVPRPRGDHPGGGVAVVYSTSLVNILQISHNPAPLYYELLEVEIKLHQQILRMAVVYRPGHRGTDRGFMEEFGQFLEEFSAKTGRLLMCGDFNYWVDSPHLKPFSPEFLELTDQNNFVNHVSHPTHILGHTLDLVFSPVGCGGVLDVDVENADPNTSDHALITFSFDFPKPLTHEKVIRFRNYKNADLNLASSEVKQYLGSIDTSNLTSDELVEVHGNALKLVFDHHCPEVEKKIIVRDDSPWYSTRVKFLRRARRRAEREWRKNKTDSTWLQYLSARRAVVYKIKDEKKVYYQGKVDSCGNDQRRLASIVNSLLGKTRVSLRPSVPDAELAANFVAFFAGKITRIRQELDDASVGEELSVVLQPRHIPNNVLSSFHSVEVDMISSYIRNLNKTFCPLDPINVSKLPRVYDHTVEFISKIINKCFSEGSFPHSEKHALLRPTLKKPGLDVENMLNYRPVSNLSFISKILERAILDQLQPLLQQNETIPIFQSAYRQHHSTETALIRVHNDLVENICNGVASLLVLLDLSAAFDTVDHELLLSDLYDCGVRDSALLLLGSYLSGRSQSVMVNQVVSDSTPLQYGVPQGSVLGPILFIIYISSLSLLLRAHNVTFHFYADDTQIYVRITNIVDIRSKMELLMSDIKKWMRARKLKLNDGKTDILIIRGNRRADDIVGALSINVGGSQLRPANSVRNLGVYVNSRLDFKEHVNQIVKSCYLHIRNLYLVKPFITRRCLLTLVHSLVFSRVDYCNALLVGLPNYILKKVQSVLNRAARLIFGVPPRTPTTSLHIELHWLPVRARIEFKLCLVTFKVLKFGEPRYLAELLRRPPAHHGVVVRHDNDPFRLDEPRAFQQSSFFERSFSYMAPRLYNRLPLSMRQLSSVECFKRQLKTFLFERSYDLERGVMTDGYRV